MKPWIDIFFMNYWSVLCFLFT